MFYTHPTCTRDRGWCPGFVTLTVTSRTVRLCGRYGAVVGVTVVFHNGVIRHIRPRDHGDGEIVAKCVNGRHRRCEATTYNHSDYLFVKLSMCGCVHVCMSICLRFPNCPAQKINSTMLLSFTKQVVNSFVLAITYILIIVLARTVQTA
jgi:hypothetical protein